uniref:Uncharacterized protein n=1 Tax=Rhizophora mucronata TaxID=61149 RepID=A0A2P2Q9A8_RHIMU
MKLLYSITVCFSHVHIIWNFLSLFVSRLTICRLQLVVYIAQYLNIVDI